MGMFLSVTGKETDVTLRYDLNDQVMDVTRHEEPCQYNERLIAKTEGSKRLAYIGRGLVFITAELRRRPGEICRPDYLFDYATLTGVTFSTIPGLSQ